MVAYEHRHNLANGEDNRDGHGENFSWNSGAEGATDDPSLLARRQADLRALLDTLFASTGTIMLTAGDEFGRSQCGNNNAYCQDNAIGWLDWQGRDRALEAHVAMLAERRAQAPGAFASFPDGGRWCHRDGRDMTVADWEDLAGDGFVHQPPPGSAAPTVRVSRRSRTASFGGEHLA